MKNQLIIMLKLFNLNSTNLSHLPSFWSKSSYTWEWNVMEQINFNLLEGKLNCVGLLVGKMHHETSRKWDFLLLSAFVLFCFFFLWHIQTAFFFFFGIKTVSLKQKVTVLQFLLNFLEKLETRRNFSALKALFQSLHSYFPS